MTDYVATRWYRSPELILTSDYSLPVDIWAVGCIMGELIDGQPMFPGDDTIDQIYQIMKVLGRFDERLIRLFQENANFKNLKFPEISHFQTLENRYKKKIDKVGLSLLSQLLSIDEKTRPTAEQALQHPFFADLLKEDTELLEELRKDNQTILQTQENKFLNKEQSIKTAPNHKLETQKRFAEKENLGNKTNVNTKPAKKTSQSPQVKKTEIVKDEVLEYKLTQITQREKPAESCPVKVKEQKMTDSSHEKQKEGLKKYQIKNKSENMDYKMKTNQKKFGTANSTNFVIKKANNFGFSLYNQKEPMHAKMNKKNKLQPWSMAQSSLYRGNDVYGTQVNPNGLFPSIQNLRLNETRSNWNYKLG